MTPPKGHDDKIKTFLLSIVTAGAIGCFAFLWKINSTMAILQEHDTENIRIREEWGIKTNNIQLDIRDIRERVIRIESQQKR